MTWLREVSWTSLREKERHRKCRNTKVVLKNTDLREQTCGPWLPVHRCPRGQSRGSFWACSTTATQGRTSTGKQQTSSYLAYDRRSRRGSRLSTGRHGSWTSSLLRTGSCARYCRTTPWRCPFSGQTCRCGEPLPTPDDQNKTKMNTWIGEFWAPHHAFQWNNPAKFWSYRMPSSTLVARGNRKTGYQVGAI